MKQASFNKIAVDVFEIRQFVSVSESVLLGTINS